MTFPGTFARERPDHPAVVMAGSGDTLTYRDRGHLTTVYAAALADELARAMDL